MQREKRKRLTDTLCKFLMAHHTAIVLVIAILTAVFFYGALNIRGEVILQDMLPYDHQYLKLHAKFSKIFGGGGSGVAIALKVKDGDIFNHDTLKKLQSMQEEVEMWDEVYRSLTVSIASRSAKVVKTLGKGEIKISALMWPEVPTKPEAIAQLKKDIYSNPAYKGTLIAGDGSQALILTEFKEDISYRRVFDLLQALRNKYTDSRTTVHIVGFPMLMGWIISLQSQMYMIFAVSLGLMVVILFLIFRSLVGMMAPLINALVLTIWGLGFIGFTGTNFSPLLYVLGFLVGARMLSNSVQITYRYFEELHAAGNDKNTASYQTMRAMLMPNVTAVITDAAGFLVLIMAQIVLLQQLAVIMTFWMITIVLTGFLVPAICNFLPLRIASETWSKERAQVDWQSAAITRVTQFAIGSGKYAIGLVMVGLLLFGGWQMSKLKIGDPSPGSPLFWGEHRYNQDQRVINTGFNVSSENLMLFYEGQAESVYHPVLLNTFEAFDRHMKRELPDIYKSSSSLINMIKMVNVTLHDGDRLWHQLPREETLLTGLIGSVRSNADRSTLARFVDEGLERSQISLYFSDHTSDNLLRIRDAAYRFFDNNHPMKLDKGEFRLAGGRIGMEIALNEEMKRSHALIDATVLAAVFLLCVVSFKSIVAGLMLVLPLIFANILAAAYMSVMNIGLSINTLPVAAIGVGVGVDFAIYLYSRCIEEFANQKRDWRAAIIQSVCTTGKAVIYTGLTVILPIVSWYFLSDMKFQAEVGFFLAMIMGVNVLLTITLHPLMIYWIKPKFISKDEVTTTATAGQPSYGTLK